jgi:tetratricopeptide (TPR) repeat protein
MEDFEKSVEYADKCIALAKEIGNQRYLGFGYMTGGEALIKMGEVERSKEYFQNSQDIFWDSDDAYVHGCLFTLLGMIDTEVSSYKEAREAFEKARDYLEETDIRYYLARVYHEYGSLEEKQGNYSDARHLYENALDILVHDKCIREAQEVKTHLDELEEKKVEE